MDDKINKYKERKKNMIDMFPFLLFGAFFIILVVMVLTVTAKTPSKKPNTSQTIQSGEENTAKEGDVQILAVLKEIDTGADTMTLLDIESGQDIILTFTGGTNIADKYEKVMAVSQLNLGEMVDAYYNTDTSMISKLQISNLAWEYKGVSNWSLDDKESSFTIADSKYQYSRDLVIVKQEKLLNVADLNEKDELIVKGYDRKIWSILVTRGHGAIRFKDYEDFIGGTVYIGNQEILPVVSDMTVTVQEGNYEITMEKGSLKGTKKLEVLPFEEAVLNMEEFKLPPVQTKLVKFYITPDGADLYIDDEQKDYGKSIELEYGEHSIKVALGGYTTYSGKLEIGESSKTVSIDLVESQSTGDKQEAENQNTAQDDPANGVDSGTKDNTGTPGDDSENISQEDSNGDENTTANTDYEQVKADKNIYIQEPEGASAYFDGQFKGTVPVSFPKETGTHYITLIKSGYQTKTFTVYVKDDGEDVKYNFSDMDKSE